MPLVRKERREATAGARAIVALACALGACADEGPAVGTTPADADDATSATDDAARTTGTATGFWPRPCSDLYDGDRVPDLHLTIAPAEWSALESECAAGVKAYHPAELGDEGETVAAMVRLKGGWSWSCQKMQFVVSFNELDPHGRFHGLRKLSLDAAWYDRTLLHERLAFGLFGARGLPTSCVNHAKLFVNGAYYGLFSNTERLDKEYLQRNFAEADGDLFKGGTGLETNEDHYDPRRHDALLAAKTVADLRPLVDLDEAVAEWAVEAMIPATDNYWAGVEINYFLYDHPTRGFLFLPYDMDATFGDTAYPDGSLVFPDAATADPITWEHTWWGKEPLVMTVLADPYWCERFVAQLRNARAAYDPEALVRAIERWDAQIAPALADDPHKTASDAEHAQAILDLEAFVRFRAAFVDAWLEVGDHCPTP